MTPNALLQHRRSTFLPFAPPAVGPEEAAAVAEVIASGWLSTGPKAKAFEERFGRSIEAPAALALNSCTAGLHVALVASGVRRGDEVITTPMTFCASVNVIEHVGARPVLADVEPDTLNLDPARVAQAITPRTRAIIAVHFAGHPAELDELRALAAEYGLVLIEDAAHAYPAAYRGRPVGSGANPAAFSFYATKNLTTGEGGMLTGDAAFIDRARVVSLHGMSRDAWRRYAKGGSWFYEVVAPGFKYNMPDLAAAIGLVQLDKIAGFQARRRAVVARYLAGLGDHPALTMPASRPHVDHAWHLFVVRLDPEQLSCGRDEVIARLGERNVGVSVHFIPIHRHPFYRDRYGAPDAALPVASAAYPRLLSLPLHPGLSDADVDDVIHAVRDVLDEARR